MLEPVECHYFAIFWLGLSAGYLIASWVFRDIKKKAKRIIESNQALLKEIRELESETTNKARRS